MRLLYRNWARSFVDTQQTGCSHASAAHPPPEYCLANAVETSSTTAESSAGFRPACAICCDAAVTSRQRFGCYSANGTRGVDLSDAIGSVPGVVPFDVASGWPADPGYSAAIITVPHALWKRSGDVTTMALSYDGMKAYAEYLLRHLTDGLVRFGMLGDWLSLEPADQGSGNSDIPRVSAFSGALSMQMMAEMATAQNASADAARYGDAARSMRQRYHEAFYKAELRSYGNCSQIANILPLVLGCVPQELLPGVVEALVDSLSSRCTGLKEPTILTGGVGSRHVWHALVLARRADLALQLALKETSPSLAWMISQGPGTFWEDWGGSTYTDPRGSSKNHHMLTGGFGIWLLDDVAGIRASHDAIGRAALTVDLSQTSLIGKVGKASASVETAAGRAAVEWVLEDTPALQVSISAPHGVQSCLLQLPAPGSGGAVLRGDQGRVLWSSDGSEVAGNSVSVELGAGEHVLEYASDSLRL